MIRKLKRINKKLRRLIDVEKDIDSGLARVSYSQEGEDIIIASLLEKPQIGFFVDVGAHHPKRFSNTYVLYRRGWSGINVDPTPGCMALFRGMRPRDTNLEVGVAREKSARRFFVFEEGALNTFDAALAEERRKAGWTLLQETTIKTCPLRDILREHCRTPIDLLNVDAEGFDLEVLESNDWTVYRPRLVCVEALGRDEDPTAPCLAKFGYRLTAMTGRSRIYMST